MRIRWTPSAAADLLHISDYLRQRHPNYRQPTMRKLYGTIRALKQNLQRGRMREEVAVEISFESYEMCGCVSWRSW